MPTKKVEEIDDKYGTYVACYELDAGVPVLIVQRVNVDGEGKPAVSELTIPLVVLNRLMSRLNEILMVDLGDAEDAQETAEYTCHIPRPL